MRISNAKSDESMGITGLVVPRHSLENDLVGSLNLKKKKIISMFLNTMESKLEKIHMMKAIKHSTYKS